MLVSGLDLGRVFTFLMCKKLPDAPPLVWFKHILFMMKRIGRGLICDKSPLLEGLFTRELTHTHSHTTT